MMLMQSDFEKEFKMSLCAEQRRCDGSPRTHTRTFIFFFFWIVGNLRAELYIINTGKCLWGFLFCPIVVFDPSHLNGTRVMKAHPARLFSFDHSYTTMSNFFARKWYRQKAGDWWIQYVLRCIKIIRKKKKNLFPFDRQNCSGLHLIYYHGKRGWWMRRRETQQRERENMCPGY